MAKAHKKENEVAKSMLRLIVIVIILIILAVIYVMAPGK